MRNWLRITIAALLLGASFAPGVASADQEFGGCDYGQEVLVVGLAESSIRIVYNMIASYDERYSLESFFKPPKSPFDEYLLYGEVKDVQSWERVSSVEVTDYWGGVSMAVLCRDADADSEYYGPIYHGQ